MKRRRPYRLWRAITADLLRLITLSAAVLVAVIALAAAVKPISDGLLQSENFIKFVLYAIPPMLAYALPFAAGFGATLVYHRIAHDNESVAAHAGGVSHRALLFPAVITGLILALVLVALNEVLIPFFLLKMQRLITRDLATWVVQEIDRGKSVEMGGMMVHAASAERIAPAPGSAATDVLYLTKVAAIDTDTTGKPITEVTAAKAWIIMFPWEGNKTAGEETGVSAADMGKSRAVMRLENVVANKQGQGAAEARESLDVAWSLGNPFRDNVKFLSWSDLRAITKTPERMNWVDIWRKDLAFCVAQQMISLDLRKQITAAGRIVLRDDVGEEVTVDARVMERTSPQGSVWRLSPAPAGGANLGANGGEARKVIIHMRRHGVKAGPDDSMLTIAADSAVLTIDIGKDRLDRSLTMQLDMKEAEVLETGARQGTHRATYRVSNLRPGKDPTAELLAKTSPELLIAADESTRGQPPSGAMVLAAKDLAEKVEHLKNEVLSKQNERMVMAVSCFVMVFCGAVTALRLSKRLPLTVYMFTFVPAVICIVTMSGGQQVTAQSGASGLFLMWSGVAGLLGYSLLQFRALARH